MKYQGLYKTLIFFLLLIGSCSNQTNSSNNNIDTSKIPDQEGWNSTLIATTNGNVTAVIKYGYMKRFNKKKLVLFEEGVTVDFYDKNGAHTSQLTSNKGKLDENTNNVEAYENVVVVSDSGISLTTEKLWWDNALEKVVSDQYVTITTVENDTLHGVGFESDQTLSNWTINKVSGKTDKSFQLDNLNKSKSATKDTLRKEIVSITNTDGDVLATIRSEKLDQQIEEQVLIFISNIYIRLFNQNGNQISTITADSCRLDDNTNDFEVFKNVTVKSDSGMTLQTEHLQWNKSSQTLISDQQVTLITSDLVTFEGTGFEADQSLINWTIKELKNKASEHQLDNF